MFCEKCGAKNIDNAKFCASCGHKFEIRALKTNGEKNIFLALIISFFLTGLGIAYAGNVKKGILLFIGGLIFYILGIGISICAIIGIAIWVYGLYETYNQVQMANGIKNPNLIEDWKSWEDSKKIGAAFVVIIIFLFVVGGVINAFTPDSVDNVHTSSADSNANTDLSSSSSSSSSGSSSGSSSSSSSSNGQDVSSHYEGEHGSSDTHGTVYNDGSVEAHQTGHTDYGDYRVDSYMDSNGNIHGTVDVGGRTYHVSY